MTSILDLSEKVMGKVHTPLTIINRADQIRAEDGTITTDQIRSLNLDRVLVDTGATTLCLPPEMIAKLGLKLLKEVDVATATGIGKARIFQDAKICLYGREGTFECLELPGGNDPLLGVIPLENQALKVLPSESVDTYLTIL
jgi:predicted aspartyl protease